MSLTLSPPLPAIEWLGEPELAFASGLTGTVALGDPWQRWSAGPRTPVRLSQ
jgi:hypothetical protein